MESIYCAYDNLNTTVNKNTGEEGHICEKYGSIWCLKCNSKYDGERIKEYMNTHDRIEH